MAGGAQSSAGTLPTLLSSSSLDQPVAATLVVPPGGVVAVEASAARPMTSQQSAGRGSGGSNERADESNILEATHESLIPLEEEEDEDDDEGRGEEEEDIDRELMHEARSLAREIGRHGGGALAEDIQDIVDELLEREPGGAPGVGPDALIRIHSPGDDGSNTERSSGEESLTESDLDDLEDEEMEDNFNSAGEELDEDEGDESHHHNVLGGLLESRVDEVGSDLSSSQTDTDEEDDEEEEGDDGGEGFRVGAEEDEDDGVEGMPDDEQDEHSNDPNANNVAGEEVCSKGWGGGMQ